MQFNVAQLLKERIGSSRDYEVDGAVNLTDDGGSSPVHGRVQLTRTDRGILVKATVNTEIEVACGRCLALFRQALALDFEEEYFPTVDVISGVPLALAGEPGSFTIDGQHVLDLSEAVRQYALVAVPMKPLCRPDCAGICPGCGRNMNFESCGCPPPTVDRRWAVLTRLASQQKGTS